MKVEKLKMAKYFAEFEKNGLKVGNMDQGEGHGQHWPDMEVLIQL